MRLIHTNKPMALAFFLYFASWTPRQQLVVVFPTPPLPPTNTHWRVSWSIIFLREGSGRSESSNSAMVTVICWWKLTLPLVHSSTRRSRALQPNKAVTARRLLFAFSAHHFFRLPNSILIAECLLARSLCVQRNNVQTSRKLEAEIQSGVRRFTPIKIQVASVAGYLQVTFHVQ